MKEARISRRAANDLVEIHGYFEREASEEQAAAIVDELLSCANQLAFPLIGLARNDLRPDWRAFPVGEYMLYYRVIAEGIELSRVIHGRRNQLEALNR